MGTARQAPFLPGWILHTLVSPFVAAFVENRPLREEPLSVDLDQLVFVVSEPVEDTPAVGIVVGLMKPVRASGRLVAIDLDHDI